MPEFRKLPSGAFVGEELRPGAWPEPWRPRTDELGPVVLDAWRQYYVRRDEGHDHPGALVLVAEALLDDEQVGAGITVGTVAAWARDKHWEEAWQALLGAGTLTREELRADVRLTAALDDRLKAHEVYLKAYARVMTEQGGKGSVQQFHFAHQSLQQADAVVTAAEEVLYKRALQQAPHPEWSGRREVLVRALAAQYGKLGPQYEILLYRLADAEVRCEQLTANGQVDGEEYARANDTIMKLTAQLQRYTESTKTELVEHARHEGVEAVLHLLQFRVLDQHPELMRQTIAVIKRELLEEAS